MASFFVLDTIKEGKAEKVYYRTDKVLKLIITENVQNTFKAVVICDANNALLSEHTLTKADPDILQCDAP